MLCPYETQSCHLARMVGWNRHEPDKAWVTLEKISGISLKNFPWCHKFTVAPLTDSYNDRFDSHLLSEGDQTKLPGSHSFHTDRTFFTESTL